MNRRPFHLGRERLARHTQVGMDGLVGGEERDGFAAPHGARLLVHDHARRTLTPLSHRDTTRVRGTYVRSIVFRYSERLLSVHVGRRVYAPRPRGSCPMRATRPIWRRRSQPPVSPYPNRSSMGTDIGAGREPESKGSSAYVIRPGAPSNAIRPCPRSELPGRGRTVVPVCHDVCPRAGAPPCGDALPLRHDADDGWG